MSALHLDMNAKRFRQEHEQLRTQFKLMSLFAEAACTREIEEMYRRLDEVRTVIAELVRIVEGQQRSEGHFRSVLWFAKAFLMYSEPGSKPMRWEDVQVAREMLLQACKALHDCIEKERDRSPAE